MKFVLILCFVASAFALGGWEDVDANDEEVTKIIPLAGQLLSEQFKSKYHARVMGVNKVRKQIVAGVNYRIEMIVAITNCEKALVSYEKIDECEPQEGIAQRKCETVLFYQAWKQTHQLKHFNCIAISSKVKKPATKGALKKELEKQMFEDFVAKHQKVYKDQTEKEKRFEIFKMNLKKIEIFNKLELGTAKYGVTQFADLTEDEFSKRHLGLRTDLDKSGKLPLAKIPTDPIPESFDWRNYSVVTAVKNQGTCGSCWAFSTTGNIEGQWAIKKKKLVSLSEQELVDCDKLDEGCNGGLPSNAYKEIIRLGGLENESEYPYEGEDEKCTFKKTEVKVFINSSVAISQNETDMASWLAKNGPISIGINANAMQFYFGGISHPWKFLCSPKNLDHGVLIVGYGVHTYPIFKKTIPFWIIKNSWGASWGEQGYYRVYRGDGTCGLNMMATSSIVD